MWRRYTNYESIFATRANLIHDYPIVITVTAPDASYLYNDAMAQFAEVSCAEESSQKEYQRLQQSSWRQQQYCCCCTAESHAARLRTRVDVIASR